MLPSNRRERNTLCHRVMPRRRSGDRLSMRLQGLKRELICGYLEGRQGPAHTPARRLTPGGARFAAPGICSPNCASHRGFGTFEGIACRDIRHWRMIHGASHPTPVVDQFDCGGGFPLVSECRRRIFREWRQLSDAIAALSTNALKQSS
jgi:hypothetical protein